MRAAVPFVLVLAGCSRATFISSEGGFSVAISGEPKIQKLPGPFDIEATMYTWNNKGTEYMVSWYPLPRAMEDVAGKLLDDAAERGIEDALAHGGRLKTRKQISINGNPGYELYIHFANEELTARTCVAGGRLYQVSVSGPPVVVTSGEAARFLSSFTLID